MRKNISLSEYVKKRNGVSLGASRSMRNMLRRSLGAGSFPQFWQYWNPIWGYYLSLKVMRPLGKKLPRWLATITTFAVSGLLHDLAVSLVKWKLFFLFTPWFSLMGFFVLVSTNYHISYQARYFLVRALINMTIIVICFLLAILFHQAFDSSPTINPQ